MISAFGTVNKELWKGLEDMEVGERVETIQTTTLWSPGDSKRLSVTQTPLKD